MGLRGALFGPIDFFNRLLAFTGFDRQLIPGTPPCEVPLVRGSEGIAGNPVEVERNGRPESPVSQGVNDIVGLGAREDHVEHDVEEAREHFNVSAWDLGPGHSDEAAEEYEEGEMPLWFYTPLHPAAVLSPEARGAFIRGLTATFGTEEEHERESGEDH